MDLSTFSAASDSGSLAADVGGDASGNPLSYAKTAYDVASSLGKLSGLFGGGTYAQNTGLHLQGTITSKGLQASVIGNTTGGNNPWSASSNAEISSDLTVRIPASILSQLGTAAIPIDITSAQSTVQSLVDTFNSALARVGITSTDYAKVADTTTSGTGLAAPDLSNSGTTATGMPGTVAGTSGSTTTSTAGGSTVTSAPIVASPIVGTIIPSVPDWIVYIGLGLVAWHLYKHGKA